VRAVMPMSPKRLRAELRELSLELHWRQWCALGVAGHVEPERHRVIDLESLLVSSSRLGRADARLARQIGEWLGLNRDWVSTSRLRRIGDVFSTATGSEAPMVGPNTDARGRAKVVRPVTTQPVLLQLQLRALLGNDVRADVFGYLLFNQRGNSSSISRAVYVNQKRVYNVLERWFSAGFVRRTSGGYSLVAAAIPPAIAEASDRVEWIDWAATFAALARLSVAMTKTVADDEYVLASLARDVTPALESPTAAVGVTLPPANRYPGAAYLEPFSDAVVDWLRRLLDQRS
jgi:hypothetical protein